MKAGFGPLPDESVLRRLEAKGGRPPRLRLPEPGAAQGPPPVAAPVRYQVLGEIARGGVGVVLHGRDSDLGRDVAMKVVRPEYADNPEILERFLEEAQIGGQLQHPGIVPVYEMGLDAENRAFFTMKLVKGDTLAALLRQRTGPAAERRRFLAIFEQVCQTIAYAHARGVIHRDLKPSNVMVGAFGEVVVLDWGFAKVLAAGGVADERPRDETVIRTSRAASGSESQAGSVLGTPGYMPPEQALGRIEAVDTRSDVFSLGAILCEILTGAPPYTGAAPDLLLLAAQARLDDAFARLDGCGAEADLTALAKRCLAPEPTKRPRDASAVAQGIADHLAGVDERARAAELDAAQARVEAGTARRARVLTLGLAGAIVATLLVGGGATAWTERDRRDRRERTQGEVSRALAEAHALLGEAESGGAAGAWESALAAAQKAAKLADAGYEPGLLAIEARSLEARVEASRLENERERVFLQRLEETRLDAPIDTSSRKRAREGLSRALADYGIDVLTLDDEEVLALAGRSRIRAEIAEALDAWVLKIDGIRGPLPDEARRLLRLAKAIDPDRFRCDLRDALLAEDGAMLLRLAAAPAALANGPTGASALAEGLWDARERDAALTLLFAAQRTWPQDFGLNVRLASALRDVDPPRYEESAPFWAAAGALRPDFVIARQQLGNCALRRDDFDGAIEIFRAAIEVRSDSLDLLQFLAAAHKKKGDLEEATAKWRGEARQRPSDPGAHALVGEALLLLPDREAAVAAFREAVRLAPESAYAHNRLGTALWSTRDHEGAIAQYREAASRDPAALHYKRDLAKVLAEDGQADEAITTCEEVLRWEKDPRMRIWLGDVQRNCGRLAEAEATLRKAVEETPNMPRAHEILGLTLVERGDAEGAIHEFRETIRLWPTSWWAYKELALLFNQLQRFEEAREVLEKAIELEPLRGGPQYFYGYSLLREGRIEEALERFRKAQGLAVHSSWKDDLESVIRQCDACLRVRDRLPTVLSGELQPTGDEARDFADLCLNLGYYAKASELYGNRENRLYLAACAAAMAGAGEGRDAPTAPAARTALRMSALERLRILLANKARLATDDPRHERGAVAEWRYAAALAGVRGDALDRLPPAETERWLAFWRDYEEFIRRTRR